MEVLLKEMGKCGKFQVCHVTLVQMCRFVAAWSFSLMIFGLYNPGWNCVQINSTTSGTSTPLPSTMRLSSLHNESKINVYSDSSVENDTYLDRMRVKGTCDVIDSCVDIEFSRSSSTVVSEFGLVCDRLWIGYIVISALSLGMLVGALAWGQIGERFGRKTSLYGCMFTMTLSCGLAVFSPIWQVYAMFTFLIGFGAGSVSPSATVLCMEFLDSKWRARLTSIPVWNVGILCFAFTCFILRDWRYVHLVGASIGAIVCLGVVWTPESLRWLVVHGKTPRAEEVISKVSKTNNKTVNLDSLNLLIDNDFSIDTSRNYTYADLFRNRDIRTLTFKLVVIRIVLVLTYDIIGFGIQSLPGNFYTNVMILSLIDIPLAMCIGLLANKIGRRRTGILFFSTGVICCTIIIVSLLSMEESNIRGLLITSMALTNRSAVTAYIVLNFVYSAELLPTAVRNLSMGFNETVARIIGMIGPFLIPRDHLSMVICFAVLMVAQTIAAIVVFTLAETKKRPLTDVLRQERDIQYHLTAEDSKC